jgi:hypothetical protein
MAVERNPARPADAPCREIPAVKHTGALARQSFAHCAIRTMSWSLRHGLRLCSLSSINLRGARTAEDFQLTRLKHISCHKRDDFSIIENTEIRAFKISFAPKHPDKKFHLIANERVTSNPTPWHESCLDSDEIGKITRSNTQKETL